MRCASCSDYDNRERGTRLGAELALFIMLVENNMSFAIRTLNAHDSGLDHSKERVFLVVSCCSRRFQEKSGGNQRERKRVPHIRRGKVITVSNFKLVFYIVSYRIVSYRIV